MTEPSPNLEEIHGLQLTPFIHSINRSGPHEQRDPQIFTGSD